MISRIQSTCMVTLAAFFVALLTGCISPDGAPVAPKTVPAPVVESQAQRDERMAWFREARFGMFIHWGLYSRLAGEWQGRRTPHAAEWIQEQFAIPASSYMPLAKDWNPTGYNPREWVKRMKLAGVRYICITTKHHDGFCLWPTRHNNDWNVAITPHGKDLIKPLAEACKAEGLIFCIYHSVMDWHHPDWPGQSYNDLRTGTPDKARFKRDYLYPQLKELLTEYGDIGMIWLDGTWDKAWTSEDGKELENFLRATSPKLVVNNRSGYRPPQKKYEFKIGNTYSYIQAGDYISPEGEIPPTGLPGIDWETCQTMQPRKNWGYSRHAGFRPFPELLRELIDVSSKGGNLLLNVSPDGDGLLVPEAISRLDQFAEWMSVNAESIHGTSASPFPYLPFKGRCTQRPGKLYLHVFDWPKDGQLAVPLASGAKRAYLLSDKSTASLPISATKAGLVLTLPEQAPDAIASVIVVELDGKPDVVPTPPPKPAAKNPAAKK